jgi:drug/metabolite transporter (DMT)-like permease
MMARTRRSKPVFPSSFIPPDAMTVSSADSAASPMARLLQTAVPAVFVVMWATGFTGARLGLPYAPPITLLFIRFAIVMAVMLMASLAMGARWPEGWRMRGHVAVVGLLMHSGYLGGVYCAIAAGVPSGISALIVGLQPLLTAAVVGPFLGEKVSPLQWLGLAVGLGGVALVLADKLHFDHAQSWGVILAFGGLLSVTAATLYQKRFCSHIDLRTGAVIQYSAACLVLLPLALLLGWGPVQWTGELIFAMAWLVLVLSLGAVSIFYLLIRKGSASRVTSLFYLTPPMAALFGWILFGERMGPVALAGMGLTALGVALVMRRPGRVR